MKRRCMGLIGLTFLAAGRICAQYTISTAAGNGNLGFIDGVPAAQAEFCNAAGVAVDAAGNVYVGDTCNFRIRMISTSGVVNTVAGGGNNFPGIGDAALTIDLTNPANVAVDSAGNFYIGQTGGGPLLKVVNGVAVAVDSTSNQYNGVVVDSSGNTYFSLQANSQVWKVAPGGGVSLYAGTASGTVGCSPPNIGKPFGLALDSAGNLYIADQWCNAVWKVTPAGVQTAFAGNPGNSNPGSSGDGGPATSALLNGPQGVAVDPPGNVYIADTLNAKIRKVNTSGVITTIAGTGSNGFSGDGGPATSAQLYSPYGVAVGPGGKIYIGDLGNYRIRVLTPITVPLTFIPMTPCRVVDTRFSNGGFGSPSLAAGVARSFVIPSGSCNVPATALAFSLNVTVVPQGPLAYLTLWPSGQPQPFVSTLNSNDGRTKANAAIIPAGTLPAGGVTAYATGPTDLILDIDGYFVPSSSGAGLYFFPLPPCRVADTRFSSYGSLGPPSLGAGQSRTFPILASNCNIPHSAQAYSLNFTAVPPGPLGYITTYPTGQTRPLASTLNAPTGTIVANAAIVPAGGGGSVDIFASDATDLVIDINGYFGGPATGQLSLYSLTPCRAFDSRLPPGTAPFTGEKDINVALSGCGAPPSAQSFVFNATVVPPGPLLYLTLWPQGSAQPLVSTLNAVDGAVTSNLAIVPSNNGSISAIPSSATYLVLDIFGYFGQ